MKIFVALLCLGLAACSGMRGKADDLFSQGAYEDAVHYYESALAEDPKDEKAREGLKRARAAHIDKELIAARMARLAGNRGLNLDILLEIVKLEAKWAYYPPGAVAGTQKEESAEALQFISGQVQSSIDRNRPLFGLYLVTHYQPIFAGDLAGQHQSLTKKLTEAGKHQCNALAKTQGKKFPYYSGFVRKVCTAWGVAEKGDRSQKQKRATLYRGIRVASNIAGLPKEYHSDIGGALEKAFENTPWFDPKGDRILVLALNGTYRQESARIPEQRIHGYSVSTPYTDYETVTRTRIVDDKEEQYTETQPVTRFRDEPRYQPYNGLTLKQDLELRAKGSLLLGNVEKTLRIDGQIRQEGFEHSWNLPNIGLTPQKAGIEDPESWVKQQAGALSSDLAASAGELWDNLYCDPMATSPTLLATGDQVHRCLRNRHSTPPPFVNAWYEKFFGVSVAQADEILNLSDL